MLGHRSHALLAARDLVSAPPSTGWPWRHFIRDGTLFRMLSSGKQAPGIPFMTRHRFSAQPVRNGKWTILDGARTTTSPFWSGLSEDRARLVADFLNGLIRGRAEGHDSREPSLANRRRVAAQAVLVG